MRIPVAMRVGVLLVLGLTGACRARLPVARPTDPDVITYWAPLDDLNRQPRDIVGSNTRSGGAFAKWRLLNEPDLVTNVGLEQARRVAAEVGSVALGALERAWRVEGIAAPGTVKWLKAKRVDLGDGRDLVAVAFRACNDGAARSIEWWGLGLGTQDGLLVECGHRMVWRNP